MAKMNSGLTVKATGKDAAEITIYGDIDRYGYDGVTAKDVRTALKSAGDVKQLKAYINSGGGDVFEGLAIYSLLAGHPAHVTVKVDGIAASMGSVIAMAGDEIEMADSAWLMLHNPIKGAYGDADDMRHSAELLDKIKNTLAEIYAKRTGKTVDEISELMDDETWLTATEAVEHGFASRTTPGVALAAAFDPRRFEKVPDSLIDRGKTINQGGAKMPDTKPEPPQAATFAELKEAIPEAGDSFLCKMLEKNATLVTAQKDFVAEQAAELKAAKQEAEDAKAEAAKAKADAEAAIAKASGKPGHKEVPEDTAKENDTSDPVAEWDEAVSAKVAKGMKKSVAVSAVNREQPGLREKMLAAVNN